jgi:hypothetical protein
MLLHKFDQTSLQFPFRLNLRSTVHLGRSGNVFMPKQSLHFFECEPCFLSPRADGVAKTVPANLWESSFSIDRPDVILQQLTRPERSFPPVEGRCEHPVVRLVVRSDRSPLVQKFGNILRQCQIGPGSLSFQQRDSPLYETALELYYARLCIQVLPLQTKGLVSPRPQPPNKRHGRSLPRVQLAGRQRLR